MLLCDVDWVASIVETPPLCKERTQQETEEKTNEQRLKLRSEAKEAIRLCERSWTPQDHWCASLAGWLSTPQTVGHTVSAVTYKVLAYVYGHTSAVVFGKVIRYVLNQSKTVKMRTHVSHPRCFISDANVQKCESIMKLFLNLSVPGLRSDDDVSSECSSSVAPLFFVIFSSQYVLLRWCKYMITVQVCTCV